jgi:hypothetical protein
MLTSQRTIWYAVERSGGDSGIHLTVDDVNQNFDDPIESFGHVFGTTRLLKQVVHIWLLLYLLAS